MTPNEMPAIDIAFLEARLAENLEVALCDGKMAPDLYVIENRAVLRGLIEKAAAAAIAKGAKLKAELESVLKERDELAAWKASAMEVMRPDQEIGKALGVPLGRAIHDKVLPGILALQAELKIEGADLNARQLVRRAVEHPHAWGEGVPRWSAVGSIFSLGMTSSVAICRAFDLDPFGSNPLALVDDEEAVEILAQAEAVRNAAQRMRELREGRFPRGSFVRHHGLFCMVTTGDGCPPDQLALRFENGNTWWKPVEECEPLRNLKSLPRAIRRTLLRLRGYSLKGAAR